ncbi:MAG: TRAP transporter TatT component family protein [Candidatus Marinimicrobia bacterium]|nr:TRAP transporter TatT component family protein [Candidatus Neomarinimicrobiota bacterium]
MSGLPKPQKPITITLGYADSLWLLRADTANAQAALEVFKQLAASDSTSIEIWAKLSRSYYFCGQYLTQAPQARDNLFMQGYEVSQTVLNQNSNYRNLLFSTGDESIAIRGLDKTFIEALYWGMANYGQWLATKSSLVRLGQREIIWATLEHINVLDSTFFYGAYYRFKGALLGRDPETEKDTARIKRAFDEAIQRSPDYLGNYTLMAQYYCPRAKDKNLFYQLLTKVITTKPNPDLPYYPENLYERVLAERLMVKAEKENWFNQ